MLMDEQQPRGLLGTLLTWPVCRQLQICELGFPYTGKADGNLFQAVHSSTTLYGNIQGQDCIVQCATQFCTQAFEAQLGETPEAFLLSCVDSAKS